MATLVRVRDSNGRFVRPTPRQTANADVATGATTPDLTDPSLYINYQLSILSFSQRVFEQAMEEQTPLLQRVHFIGIVSQVLDEFFTVRVAGLKRQVRANTEDVALDGMTPREALHDIHQLAGEMMEAQCRYLRDVLTPALAADDIHLLSYQDLDDVQRQWATDYFLREVFPVLTPLAIDSGHPFPHISNLSLNLLVVVRDSTGEHYARVKIPGLLPRLVQVPTTTPMQEAAGIHRARALVWIEHIVIANLQTLFPGMEIVSAYPFHVTRDANVEFQELGADDLLEVIDEQLEQRGFGFVVRLVVDGTMPDSVRTWLMEKLDVHPSDVYVINGHLGLADLTQLLRIDRPDLKYPPFVPQIPPPLRDGGDIYASIRQGDILLHHPYDSFAPVIDFIKTGSTDPNVLAIKQTLYRVGGDSPIVTVLADARDEETQVAVLVELKARGDEENNIEWARALESKGVHVAYGIPGLKVHCKAALMVRRETDGIRRYIHLGTGNYNASTARLYGDLGLLTVNEEIGADVSDLFNYLTGYSDQREYRQLLVAPVNLRQRVTELIERETTLGPKGRMILKTNHLVDERIIQALYRASQAGVQIQIICRTTCRIVPGVPGVSENIRVVSLLGRFLEHHRIYLFGNDGNEEIYCGSADLHPRNLDHRVETLFPIMDPALRTHVHEDILAIYLRDTAGASELGPDGIWRRVRPPEGEEPFSAQEWFLNASASSRTAARGGAD
jgi:polyphosphate kinase